MAKCKKIVRKISNEELADLPERWENSTVDTNKYHQSVFRAYEVTQTIYNAHKKEGGLCQEHNNKYYIA